MTGRHSRRDIPVAHRRDISLETRGISKRYPGVHALEDVSVRVEAGSVHALLGENGAGKSTLIKIVTGATAPDSGEIIVGSSTYRSLTPRLAASLGIGVIYQERQIAGHLSVTENVLLGRLPTYASGVVDWRAAHAHAHRLLGRVGLAVDTRTPAGSLSVAQLQILEIARALAVDVRILVMDEPTSSLNASEIENLFIIVSSLRAQGVAVVYISHHLDEIFRIADEATVLRDGRCVASHRVADIDVDRLVEDILGRALKRTQSREPSGARTPEAVLEVRQLSRAPGLNDVSLTVSAGEVLCITGAIGSGRRELARCLAGIEAPDAGVVQLHGRPVRGARDAIRRGVVFLPENRKTEGLLLDLSVFDNLMIGRIIGARSPVLNTSRLRTEARALLARLQIKAPSLDTSVRQLSGGNQQKVVVGRWLATGADVFVFDEPTAGIDVGSKVEIYGLLRELARAGKALVLFSSDYEEIKLIADRALVLRRGKIAGELASDEISEEGLLSLEVA